MVFNQVFKLIVTPTVGSKGILLYQFDRTLTYKIQEPGTAQYHTTELSLLEALSLPLFQTAVTFTG